MTITEAAAILERYNRWRQGADIPMEHPAEISAAIDKVVEAIRKMESLV